MTNKENKSSRTIKLISRISNLATERDISLKMFKSISKKKCMNKIEKTALQAACSALLDTIKDYDLPRFVKNKTHLQQMLDGKFYLTKEDSGFENLADQENIKYGGIIYIIKPIKPLHISKRAFTETYIGVTWKSLMGRFIEHTEDAIESYTIHLDWPNRLIECLILKALEKYITEVYSYDSEISLLYDYIKNYFLGMEKWEKKAEIEKIATILYNKYFYMEVIEVHSNYETAWARETWYIKNYPLCINGEYYLGTLFPNGLNMVLSPEKPGHRTLPMYDIIFQISLGFVGPEINEMLSAYYHINIDFRTIYSHLNKFWENWDNILKLFFRPVLQELLQHEEYDWKDIAKTLRRDASYRIKENFKKWFYCLNVTQLRSLIKQKKFDWKNLEKVAEEFKADLFDQNTVKGISVDTWIEWFIKDIGMEEISKILGYKNAESFRSSWLKQERFSIFQEKFSESYTLAVIKYRKKRTIELLTDEDFIDTLLDSRLYWIYINVFEFMRWQDYAIARPSQGLRNCMNFFEKLFKEEGLTVNNLENITASNYTQNLELYNIVIQILES